jgi:hypothetical protein
MHTIIGIDQNPKLGYYKVADEIFYSKPQAYTYAFEKNLGVSWHFNAPEFAKYNWTIDPKSSIKDLYRLRAQQLRDRYDYIRLECSGGSDSTTVLYSFVLNGIHLDEVVFRYPKAGEKGMVGEVHNYSAENTLSEWEFAAKPLFNWVKTNYPSIKLTVHDYSENITNGNSLSDESWIFTTRDWYQPGHPAKFANFGLQEHRKQADTGKHICVLHGVDKPKLVCINGHWYCYFVDVLANSPSPIREDYVNVTQELFYWTPDFPEMIIKQCHLIKNWFDLPEHAAFKHLVKYPVQNPNSRTEYEGIVKSVIYPDYDPLTWQTTKPTNSFYNEMDHWFYTNFADTKQYHAWKAGLNYLVNHVDPRYVLNKNNQATGLVWNKSLFYHLGPEINPLPQPILSNHAHIINTGEQILLWQDRKLKPITV